MSKLLDRFITDRKEKKSSHTITAYSIDIKQFIKYFTEKKNISEDEVFTLVKKFEIDDYFLELRESGGKNNSRCKDTTYNRKIVSIKEIYKFLYDRDLIDSNNAKHLETVTIKKSDMTKEIKKSLTLNEIKELKLAAENLENYKQEPGFQSSRDQLMLHIFLNVGLRNEELRELKLNDLDLKNGIIHVNKAKMGSTRSIALSDEGIRLLKNYLKERNNKKNDCGHLFLSMRNKRITRNESVMSILKKLLSHTSIAEDRVNEITVHKLRHTFATQSVRAGVDPNRVSKQLGHKSLNTTFNFYVHNNTIEDIKDNRIECLY